MGPRQLSEYYTGFSIDYDSSLSSYFLQAALHYEAGCYLGQSPGGGHDAHVYCVDFVMTILRARTDMT